MFENLKIRFLRDYLSKYLFCYTLCKRRRSGKLNMLNYGVLTHTIILLLCYIVYCTGYRQWSSDRSGYRQLSNDRCGVTGAGYEYENGGLYAYDNPTANHNDVIGGVDDLTSFSRSRYQCGGGNPTFTMEPAETSSAVSHHPQRAPSTSPSLPYLHQRRAGDYSNYFSRDDRLPQLHSAEAPNRPTTLEVRLPKYQYF